MFNSLDVLDDLVPVSELSNGRTAAVLSKADRAPVIIIKRNKPSYVLMGINDYQDLLDRLEDTEDVRLAEKRIEDNNGRATIPNADLMAELGLTEEDIAGTPTPEMAGRMARRSREGHAQTGQGRTETGAQRHRQGQRESAAIQPGRIRQAVAQREPRPSGRTVQNQVQGPWNQSGIQAGSQGRNHGHHRRRRQNGWRSLPEGR